MKYKVVYEKKAVKSLVSIDKEQQKIIIAWVEKNLVHTDEPRKYGKSLKGALKDYWRYRVGNYRLIASIDEKEVTILIVNVGHRKDIYR